MCVCARVCVSILVGLRATFLHLGWCVQVMASLVDTSGGAGSPVVVWPATLINPGLANTFGLQVWTLRSLHAVAVPLVVVLSRVFALLPTSCP